jgi:putative ABC transport system ATP-binding protein
LSRPPSLALSQLLVRYSDRGGALTALELDDLTVEPGSLLVVTGPSGSGKSTLLYAISGLLRPARGTVSWDGHDILTLGESARDRWRRRMIGFAFQDFHLLPELSPLANVLLPASFERFSPSAELRTRARSLLDRFEVPETRISTGTLSRGEQQRVALARALLFDPPVILADEPTASLDEEAGTRIAMSLASLSRDEGRTIIAVSHDPALIAHFDRRIALQHGHAVPLTTTNRPLHQADPRA